jgi:hypothetical protein
MVVVLLALFPEAQAQPQKTQVSLTVAHIQVALAVMVRVMAQVVAGHQGHR